MTAHNLRRNALLALYVVVASGGVFAGIPSAPAPAGACFRAMCSLLSASFLIALIAQQYSELSCRMALLWTRLGNFALSCFWWVPLSYWCALQVAVIAFQSVTVQFLLDREGLVWHVASSFTLAGCGLLLREVHSARSRGLTISDIPRRLESHIPSNHTSLDGNQTDEAQPILTRPMGRQLLLGMCIVALSLVCLICMCALCYTFKEFFTLLRTWRDRRRVHDHPDLLGIVPESNAEAGFESAVNILGDIDGLQLEQYVGNKSRRQLIHLAAATSTSAEEFDNVVHEAVGTTWLHERVATDIEAGLFDILCMQSGQLQTIATQMGMPEVEASLLCETPDPHCHLLRWIADRARRRNAAPQAQVYGNVALDNRRPTSYARTQISRAMAAGGLAHPRTRRFCARLTGQAAPCNRFLLPAILEEIWVRTWADDDVISVRSPFSCGSLSVSTTSSVSE